MFHSNACPSLGFYTLSFERVIDCRSHLRNISHQDSRAECASASTHIYCTSETFLFFFNYIPSPLRWGMKKKRHTSR